MKQFIEDYLEELPDPDTLILQESPAPRMPLTTVSEEDWETFKEINEHRVEEIWNQWLYEGESLVDLDEGEGEERAAIQAVLTELTALATVANPTNDNTFSDTLL